MRKSFSATLFAILSLLFAATTPAQNVGGGISMPPSASQVTGLPGPFLNFSGANLQHWRQAVAKVRDGQGDAKVLCIGDSTTFGVGTTLTNTYPTTGAYPARLASILNSYFCPSAMGLGIPPQFSGTNDSRWTVGSGWARYQLGWAGNGTNSGASFVSSTNGSTLTFTPDGGGTYDRFDVYYLPSPGNGTCNITGTGGTPVGINSSATAGVAKSTCSAASASTSNTLTVTITSTSPVWIVGVEPYLSTTSKIRVGNAGVTAATTALWVNDATYGGAPCIKAYAPDLTIICLGINDSSGAVASGTVTANIQTLINAAKVSGDVILTSYLPSNPSVNANYGTYEPIYAKAFSALATAQNLPYVDIFGRYKGTFTSAVMYSDGVHGNNLAYWDMASAIVGGLRQVSLANPANSDIAGRVGFNRVYARAE